MPAKSAIHKEIIKNSIDTDDEKQEHRNSQYSGTGDNSITGIQTRKPFASQQCKYSCFPDIHSCQCNNHIRYIKLCHQKTVDQAQSNADTDSHNRNQKNVYICLKHVSYDNGDNSHDRTHRQVDSAQQHDNGHADTYNGNLCIILYHTDQIGYSQKIRSKDAEQNDFQKQEQKCYIFPAPRLWNVFFKHMFTSIHIICEDDSVALLTSSRHTAPVH